MSISASIGSYRVGDGNKPLLIAGPCVIESADLALTLAESIARLPSVRAFQFVFKASYLKDNRSAGDSFRGPGLHEGLRVLEDVRARVGVPVLSDVHTAARCRRRRRCWTWCRFPRSCAGRRASWRPRVRAEKR